MQPSFAGIKITLLTAISFHDVKMSCPTMNIIKVMAKEFIAIVEHSICYPGLPDPQGPSHNGSDDLEFP